MDGLVINTELSQSRAYEVILKEYGQEPQFPRSWEIYSGAYDKAESCLSRASSTQTKSSARSATVVRNIIFRWRSVLHPSLYE